MFEMKPGDFSAFTIQASDASGSLYAEQGLTKREYMATAILSGFCANATSSGLSDAPKFAVQMADWLLAALNPPTDKPGAADGK